MRWSSTPHPEYGFYLVVQDDPGEPVLAAVYKDDEPHAAAAIEAVERPTAAAAIAGADHVVIPRAELVALYVDAPVDVPVIRRILGVTT